MASAACILLSAPSFLIALEWTIYPTPHHLSEYITWTKWLHSSFSNVPFVQLSVLEKAGITSYHCVLWISDSTCLNGCCLPRVHGAAHVFLQLLATAFSQRGLRTTPAACNSQFGAGSINSSHGMSSSLSSVCLHIFKCWRLKAWEIICYNCSKVLLLIVLLILAPTCHRTQTFTATPRRPSMTTRWICERAFIKMPEHAIHQAHSRGLFRVPKTLVIHIIPAVC